MTDNQPSPELEAQLRQVAAAPDPDPAFAGRLRAQLAAARPPAQRLTLGWAAGLSLGALLLVVLAVMVANTPPVAGALRQLFGYLPGVGVVAVDTPLRTLAAPVSVTRDGVSVTVKQVIVSADKTVLTYVVDGVPAAAYPQDENIPGCLAEASLQSPAGVLTALANGGGAGWAGGYEQRVTYPALDAEVNTATLVLPCLRNTLPGAAPEDWALVLTFVPAPPDLALLPIVDLTAAPVIASVTPAPATTEVAAATQSAPATVVAPLPDYGLALVLERYIPLDDGYYLIGHTTWTDPRLSEASVIRMQLLDAQGQEYPLETAYFSDLGLEQSDPSQWVYRVYGLGFSGPLTLRGTLVGVGLRTPVAFALAQAPAGFDGSVAQLGQRFSVEPIALDVAGLAATLTALEYTQQGAMTGFGFVLDTDPALRQVPLSLDGGVTGGSGGGGGSTYRDAVSGQVESYLLTDGQIGFPLSLSVRTATIAGTWETTWNPPIVAGQPPAQPLATACLTLAAWQQAAALPAALPAGLGGQLIVYGRHTADGLPPSPDNYGLFVTGLDGSARQPAGDGTWSAFNRAGTQAVYSAADGLRVIELAGGTERTLPGTTANDYNPRWSQAGDRIAFTRGDEHALYVIGADGQGLQRLAEGAAYVLGWAPGDAQVYYSATGPGGQQVRALELASGAVTDGLVLDSKGGSAALSPDGAWLAFVARVPGRQAAGLYVAHLDGSERRLLAQLDYWGVSNPVWSPDGAWLVVGVTNTDLFAPTTVPTLLNVASCQAIPLPSIEGDVQGWAP